MLYDSEASVAEGVLEELRWYLVMTEEGSNGGGPLFMLTQTSLKAKSKSGSGCDSALRGVKVDMHLKTQ